MNGGGKTALLISCVAVAGCAASTGSVKVRAIADPSAAVLRGGDDLAVARGQLVLGNVGLALEAFRNAQRANPADPAPLAGIGDCYAAMGRLDLAQSSYETALALTPNDRKLLLALAVIFEREGLPARALVARTQAAALAQPPVMPQVAAVETASVPVAIASSAAAPQTSAEIPKPRVGSITVALPAARPVDAVADRAIDVAAVDADPPAARSSSITVVLPPARPVEAAVTESHRTAEYTQAPRLERLSSGEVALVTTGKPIWSAPRDATRASESGVRWAALPRPAGNPNVQILNAARSQGLAASARTVLLDRGWRKIAIGDAAAVNQKSVVLYPASRAKLGRSLAAQFGVAAKMVERDVLVLILGRDSVDRVGPKRSS